jgi:hypothetical protein
MLLSRELAKQQTPPNCLEGETQKRYHFSGLPIIELHN